MDVSIKSKPRDASSASEPLKQEETHNGSSASSTRKRPHITTAGKSSIGASDEASQSRKRPKRRAANSVRFGSYKDIENVDLSLLESFQFEQSLYTSSSSRKPKKTTKPDSSRMKKSSLLKPVSSKKSRAASRSIERSEKNVGDQVIMSSQREEARHLKGALVNKILPPIILERLNDRGQKVTNLPCLLRKNPSDGVEIFNRKTGKIMKGEEAIPLENLAEALQEHSEYEPISRASTEDAIGSYQKARSSETAFISSNIKPQSNIRESKAKGRAALIISGPNRGLIGTISCRISGNWYVLENVFKNDSSDIDLVVHADDLKIIKTSSLKKKKSVNADQEEIIAVKDTSLEERPDATKVSGGKSLAQEPIMKTIDTLQLRIQALTDKKLKLKNLLQAAVPHAGTRYPTNNDTRSKIESQLKSLDEVISDASKQMEKYLIMKDMVISSSSKSK